MEGLLGELIAGIKEIGKTIVCALPFLVLVGGLQLDGSARVEHIFGAPADAGPCVLAKAPKLYLAPESAVAESELLPVAANAPRIVAPTEVEEVIKAYGDS